MGAASLKLKRLREKVLSGNGQLSLSDLLEQLVPLDRLRAFATEFGVTPKGGFRIERAPATVLAAKLAEERDPARLDKLVHALATPLEPSAQPAPPEPSSSRDLNEARALLSLKAQEVQRLRDDLERARKGLARAQDRERSLERQLSAANEAATRAQRLVVEAQNVQPPAAQDGKQDKDLTRRVRELEAECASLQTADEAMRRQLASERSRMRELEEELAELDALIPASRRRKKNPLPPALPAERRFVVPYLQSSFYKSLIGKERRSIEQAWHALLLFCTEGHGYPGLEVKSMGGQDTWSLRASLGLRVYFRPRPDGDVDVLELGDREDQPTTLRRLKDK